MRVLTARAHRPGSGNFMKGREVVIGVDLGTGGARVVASDRNGNITASAEQELAVES